MPKGLDAIGITATTKDQLSGEINPGSLVFLPNEVTTDWKPAHTAKVVFTTLAIPSEKAGKILFRYRIAAAGTQFNDYRLRLEMAVLPEGVTTDGIPIHQALLDAGFPGIPISIKTLPIRVSFNNYIQSSSL